MLVTNRLLYGLLSYFFALARFFVDLPLYIKKYLLNIDSDRLTHLQDNDKERKVKIY